MTSKRYSATRAALARAEERGRAQAMAIAGSFRAAQDSRLRDRRLPILASANAHRDQHSRDRLLRITEDLARNNVIAGSLIERRAEIVAGARPGLRLMSTDDDWNGAAAEFLAEWFVHGFDHYGTMGFDQFAGFVVENALHSGDGLLVLLDDGSCQWIDGVRIRNPYGRADDDRMTGGVELDEAGRPVRYHVAKWNAQGTALEPKTEPIDAGDCLYIGGYRGRRPGQVRCEPGLAVLADRLEDMERLHEATTKSAEIAAMLAVFVKSAHPEGSSVDWARNAGLSPEHAQAAQARQQGEVMLRPGMLMDLRPGEDVATTNPPQPGSQYDRMVWTNLQVMCARLGIPLEMAFYHFTTNYAAGRSAIVAAWKSVMREQMWLRDTVLTPVVRWRLALAIDRGEIARVPGWDRVQWKLPGIPTLDLKHEIDAVVNGVAGGVLTREDAVDRVNDGMGIDDFYAARGREIGREAALGIETRRPSNITETTSQVTSVDSTEQTR
jgi:lambda family phage portal protein